MKIGYARVSTDEQNLHLQRDALKKAGCAKIATEKGVSGNSSKRDGLGRVNKGPRSKLLVEKYQWA